MRRASKPLRFDEFGEVDRRPFSRLRTGLSAMRDAGIEEDAVEQLVDRFRDGCDAKAARAGPPANTSVSPVAPFSRSCSACALACAASG